MRALVRLAMVDPKLESYRLSRWCEGKGVEAYAKRFMEDELESLAN